MKVILVLLFAVIKLLVEKNIFTREELMSAVGEVDKFDFSGLGEKKSTVTTKTYFEMFWK